MKPFTGIDLFSDTVTRPSPEMRRRMAEALVGDDQLEEDPTTQKLEEVCANLLGLSGALFFPTSTMANQVALCLNTERGNEVVGPDSAHIFRAEVGGPAVHAGVMSRQISTTDGTFTPEELKRALSPAGYIHLPETKLLVIENTNNFGGGTAWPKEKLQSVITAAKAAKLTLHLDGSRIFNAATTVKTSVKELTKDFDTVTLCFSKGLGCPTGALLAFDKTKRFQARRLRHRMGGALRQSGVLAAAALYALENNIERLNEDQKNAEKLREGLKGISPHITIENSNPALSSNMVFFTWKHPKVSTQEFLSANIEKGLRLCQMGTDRIRAVTHLDVSGKQIESALKIIGQVCEEL